MAKHGDWYWHELTVPPNDKTKAFYKAVAGWDTKPMEGMPDYTLWTRNGEPSGGLMTMVGEMWDGVPPHWMVYVAVDDCDASKATVEANGGKVVHGPMDVPGVGRFIVCQDPAGAHITFMQPAEGTET